MARIDVGRKAPAFTLKDQHGTTHTLSAYAGQPVVLYFYPKDDTSGCTKEACAFEESLPDFGTSKAVVLGVSILDEASKAKFAKKYGVWVEKSMYGRKYMGIARVTYLIDGDGKVARRWDDVKVEGHADEVLAAVRAI